MALDEFSRAFAAAFGPAMENAEGGANADKRESSAESSGPADATPATSPAPALPKYTNEELCDCVDMLQSIHEFVLMFLDRAGVLLDIKEVDAFSKALRAKWTAASVVLPPLEQENTDREGLDGPSHAAAAVTSPTRTTGISAANAMRNQRRFLQQIQKKKRRDTLGPDAELPGSEAPPTPSSVDQDAHYRTDRLELLGVLQGLASSAPLLRTDLLSCALRERALQKYAMQIKTVRCVILSLLCCAVDMFANLIRPLISHLSKRVICSIGCVSFRQMRMLWRNDLQLSPHDTVYAILAVINDCSWFVTKWSISYLYT